MTDPKSRCGLAKGGRDFAGGCDVAYCFKNAPEFWHNSGIYMAENKSTNS